jgi:alkylhydroperoxidase family enzyme
MTGNDRVGISILQPKSKAERNAVAGKCCSALEMTMPMVVDDMEDTVGHLYSGMPDRLYVIDRDGRVAYKGGRGPFGFKSGEMEQSLAMLLLDQPTVREPIPAPALVVSADHFPVLDNAEARRRLPAMEQGADQPLPVWARALAEALPNTTAAMLELDFLHRARSPLDPVLRGKMRWVAAHANRCAYGEACAAADLRRAGVGEAAVRALATDSTALPEAERAALTFARKLTVDAASVTDAEVTRLIELYGEQRVVAMVQLLAYANFQDRLLLALGLPIETGGALPPLDIRFVKGKEPVAAPSRQPPVDAPLEGALSRLPDAEWSALDFSQLQKSMEAQRARGPRLRVPTWEEVRPGLPPGYPTNKPVGIRWSLVCFGHQPQLAAAWSACTRAFAQDARQDRVFEESLFWVITRSLHCFY